MNTKILVKFAAVVFLGILIAGCFFNKKNVLSIEKDNIELLKRLENFKE